MQPTVEYGFWGSSRLREAMSIYTWWPHSLCIHLVCSR